MIGVFAASAVPVLGMQPINFLIELNKITLNATDINSTGYYEINTNNSNYVDGYHAAYFCPLNATACSASSGEPEWDGNYSTFMAKPNSTFNSTYDSSIKLANTSNNTLYCNGLSCIGASLGNLSNNTLFCNGGNCLTAALNNVSNNTLFCAGLECLANTSLNTFNSTYDALNASGYIQNWNQSGFLKDWNATTWIMNWNQSGYLRDFNASGYIRNQTLYYINNTFNATYDSSIKVANTSNNTLFCNGGNCLTAALNNISNNTLFCNGLACVGASLGNLSNNSLYCNGLNCLVNGSLNTFNATYNAFNASGYIQNWNQSGYIRDFNATGYINNWNQSTFIKDWNSSTWLINWNQTGFLKNYNVSSLIINWNSSSSIINWNQTGYIKDWNSSTYIQNWNSSGYIRAQFNTTAQVQAAMNNTNAAFNITLQYVNDSKLYFGSQRQFCIYYNSTLEALVSSNVC